MSFPTVYYITQVIPSCYSAGMQCACVSVSVPVYIGVLVIPPCYSAVYAMCVCVSFGACVSVILGVRLLLRENDNNNVIVRRICNLIYHIIRTNRIVNIMCNNEMINAGKMIKIKNIYYTWCP